MTAACAVCSLPFEPSAIRRKTCSTPCAIENKMRMRRAKERRSARRTGRNAAAARRRRLTRTKACLGCGANLTGQLWLRYCRIECRPKPQPRAQLSKAKPRHPCTRCGVTLIRAGALYCVSCGTSVRKARNREHSANARICINAAVQVYRMMRGEPIDQRNRSLTTAEPYRPHCLVCGVVCQTRRARLCSESCRRERAWQHYVARYYYGQSAPRPNLPPKSIRHSGAKHRARAEGRLKEKQRRSNRRRDTKRRAIYRAFLDLNLMPKNKEHAP